MSANSKVSPTDLHIAAKLRDLRTRGNGGDTSVRLSQLAAYLGMRYQSYQKLEEGRVSFRASTLQKLAEFYGVPVSHFFDDAPTPEIKNQEEIAVVSSRMRKMNRHGLQDMDALSRRLLDLGQTDGS